MASVTISVARLVLFNGKIWAGFWSFPLGFPDLLCTRFGNLFQLCLKFSYQNNNQFWLQNPTTLLGKCSRKIRAVLIASRQFRAAFYSVQQLSHTHFICICIVSTTIWLQNLDKSLSSHFSRFSVVTSEQFFIVFHSNNISQFSLDNSMFALNI